MISDEIVWEEIKAVDYKRMGKKTTICMIVTKEGFEVVGLAYCEDVSKFDYKVGREVALKEAFEKLREYIAFFKSKDK